MGHARALITAADPEMLAREAVDRGPSVRETETLARKAKGAVGKPARTDPQSGNSDIAALERQLGDRSEEHTSELQSLMRISYAVFCLNKQTTRQQSRDQVK